MRHIQSKRGHRRKELKRVLDELNRKEEMREAVGDQLFTGREFTETMVRDLDDGVFADKEVQRLWDKFKKLTKERDDLKNKGADLVTIKHNNVKLMQKERFERKQP